jgi:hypothetical protein
MSTLEGIVRPFQTNEIQPPKTALTGNATDTANQPANLVLTPGKGGNVKTLSGSFNLTITYYRVNKPKEKPKPQQ